MKTIFDLGFYDGQDAEFYMSKGYKVVAVEGDPKLMELGKEKFKTEIAEGKLLLLHRVLTDQKGLVEFYCSEEQPWRGNPYKHLAEYDGFPAKPEMVEAVSINKLCETWGVPCYIKMDIDAIEIAALKQIFELKEKPQYLSVEIQSYAWAGIFSWVYACGYTKFQLRNQANNTNVHNSGAFGEELPDKWIPMDEVMKRYVKFRELRDVDCEELTIGSLNLHATY